MNDVVQEWVDKARRDHNNALALWSAESEDAYDVICFLAQQCIEKLLKGILVYYRHSFPKTHHLELLAELVLQYQPNLMLASDDLLTLTRASVEFRYPGENASREDADECFRLCCKLRTTLYRIIDTLP